MNGIVISGIQKAGLAILEKFIKAVSEEAAGIVSAKLKVLASTQSNSSFTVLEFSHFLKMNELGTYSVSA